MNVFLCRIIFLLAPGRIYYSQWLFLSFLAPICPIHIFLEIAHKLQAHKPKCEK